MTKILLSIHKEEQYDGIGARWRGQSSLRQVRLENGMILDPAHSHLDLVTRLSGFQTMSLNGKVKRTGMEARPQQLYKMLLAS